MSSFWQNSTTIIRQKPSKTFNQSLPTLSNHIKVLKKKETSQSIHQFNQSNQANFFRNKRNSIIRNLPEKKQTLTNFRSRSIYKLPSKYRTIDAPILQFWQALIKIEEVFNEEFNILQGYSRNCNSTFDEKIGFKKFDQFQSAIIETNPKRCAKHQFQQILMLFDRRPSKYMHNTIKLQKDQVFSKKRKHNTIIYIKTKQRQQGQQKRFDESLSQFQKKELMKQSQMFKKAERHLVLKSYTVKILFHHLNSELAIEAGMFDQALQSLYYCEYYGRKINFDIYIVPCLIMQSEVMQSLYNFDEAIKILKTALEFSILKKWKQMEMRILEKVSIVYYYRGNSYMAKYYKELSEIGMPSTESEIYIKEYSKSEELRSLEARIFSLPFDGISKKKHNQKYELDISRNLFLDHQNMIVQQTEELSFMLRSNKTSKLGIKLRKMIIENCQRAQVKKFSPNHSRNNSEVLPRLVEFNYPMQHCNQILKSHLSKGRLGVIGQKNKTVNFIRSLSFMKTLYRRLNYQLINQKKGQYHNDKENLIAANI